MQGFPTRPYQIVVTAGSALTGVNLTSSSLTDGAGHSLPASNLTFFREAYIDYTGAVGTRARQPARAEKLSHP